MDSLLLSKIIELCLCVSVCMLVYVCTLVSVCMGTPALLAEETLYILPNRPSLPQMLAHSTDEPSNHWLMYTENTASTP